MKRKSTLRKLPPKTREIARLLNELESVSNRLQKRLDEMAKLEAQSVAFDTLKRINKEESLIVDVLGGVADVISAVPAKYIKYDHDEDDAKPCIVDTVVDPQRVNEILGEINE